MMRAARLASTIAIFGAIAIAAPNIVSPVLAQTKVAPASHQAFILYEFDIRDHAAFKTLAAEVEASLKDFKGEFVMREKVDPLFGDKPTNLAVASFPTVEDAKAWLASPAVTKLKAEQDKVTTLNTYLVEKL